MIENNQKELWNKAYEKTTADSKPSNFAEEVVELLPPDYEILELGCGNGKDAAFFASKGLKVTGTDFSETVIEHNKKTYSKINGLTFKNFDLTETLPFPDGETDAVYANLSLHYFDDKTTKGIFREIYRVLKLNGFFCFTVKSVKNKLYGKGEKIKENIFAVDGHVRHFFSESYVKALLENDYKFRFLEEETEESSFVLKVIAQKKP